jgi:hypothetical protein
MGMGAKAGIDLKKMEVKKVGEREAIIDVK